MNPSHPLYELLARLDEAGIYYTLSRHRAETVLVSITLVGMRVEVDVFEDGQMELSIFRGSEEVLDGHAIIDQLIRKNSD